MTPERIRIKVAEAMPEDCAVRFTAKVKLGTGKDPCWEWTGAQNGKGYGQFWINGKNEQAHWQLLPSKPSKGMEACHKCDNRKCVNPDHIFIGTKSDNMQDCLRKGRFNNWTIKQHAHKRKTWHHGESNHAAVLTEFDIEQILATPKTRGSGAMLARKHHVSQTVISGIRSGKRWAKAREAYLRVKGLWEESLVPDKPPLSPTADSHAANKAANHRTGCGDNA